MAIVIRVEGMRVEIVQGEGVCALFVLLSSVVSSLLSCRTTLSVLFPVVSSLFNIFLDFLFSLHRFAAGFVYLRTDIAFLHDSEAIIGGVG